ncbi:hypothetical protein [Hyalangium versicolor]|nr:hypothetical protein [Hyalangium versicolor]
MSEEQGASTTSKDTAALRNRFERVKAKLKSLMEEEGMLEGS